MALRCLLLLPRHCLGSASAGTSNNAFVEGNICFQGMDDRELLWKSISSKGYLKSEKVDNC